jgi:hypothetical protein
MSAPRSSASFHLKPIDLSRDLIELSGDGSGRASISVGFENAENVVSTTVCDGVSARILELAG